LATLHHLFSPARPHRRTEQRTPRRVAVVAVLLAGTLLGTPTAALATPGQSEQNAAAATPDIQARVTAAQEKLQRMSDQAEAAGAEAMKAQTELATAHQQVEATAAQLDAARAAVAGAKNDVATLGRQAYMSRQDQYGDIELLLNAGSPKQLLQKAATLEVVGDARTEQLHQFEVVEDRQAKADRAARDAEAERDRAARAATDAKAAADAQMAGAQSDYDAVVAEKAALDEQLAAQGAGSAGAEPTGGGISATGGAVAPTAGQITSCYGMRWGTLHAGIDFAAPIGTPIYAPEGGVVVAAGPADGFGLAVAIQHGDGTITLYGHVNQFFVSTGESVSTGQRIAEVGNRGQTTGPHLHFEVHTGGLYVNRVNPVPWLTARGISLGGACS
jgi:murein DD-endopeptidase MepM/ murein hydrolase activator NlpD